MDERMLTITLSVWSSNPKTIADVTEKFAGMVHGFGLDGVSVGMQINAYDDDIDERVEEQIEEPPHD